MHSNVLVAQRPRLGAWMRDVPAAVVVFLVALPLCLGVALASNAPLFSGIVAGIVGGVVVGLLSGSQTSVSGPAAGLTAIVAAQIATLGSFEAMLLATVLAGAIQVALGIARAGFIAAFFPSSVIKGLLAAIGLILILKQVPHLFGHDFTHMGAMDFKQPGQEDTFSGLLATLIDIHPGAALVGLVSLLLLIAWERLPFAKKSPIPAPLVVVLLGTALAEALASVTPSWKIYSEHLVEVPIANGDSSLSAWLLSPDWSQLGNPAVYAAAVTIAIVASLETLLNLQAVDRIDPQQRHSPPNRELWAQGVGNMVSGLVGGLPVTSVIVRSGVNVNAGNRTRLSAILHGLLLLGCVLLVPHWLNRIPLSCLAAILIVTGFKLASPKLVRQLWSEGKPQFMPFAITVLAIVSTDLLRGIAVGMLVAIGFILHSNLRRPLRRVLEKHITGNVLRVELANQVSFLNRAALERTLHGVARGGHVLIDARNTDYIDPDILDMLEDFRKTKAPAHGVDVSLVGFKHRYPRLVDSIQFVDYSSRDVRDALTPEQVLRILQDGNERFRTGQRLTRDLIRQMNATAVGQSPMAVVLSCIDSRTPAELIFDLGIGDVFSIRVAGNITSHKVLGSMEFGTQIAGAKLILVLGHTSCGAVRAAVDLAQRCETAESALGCRHLDGVIDEIQQAIDPGLPVPIPDDGTGSVRSSYVDDVARRNVQRSMALIRQRSPVLKGLIESGKLALVGGLYDVHTGEVSFFALDGGISESVLTRSAQSSHAARSASGSRPLHELPSPPTATS